MVLLKHQNCHIIMLRYFLSYIQSVNDAIKALNFCYRIFFLLYLVYLNIFTIFSIFEYYYIQLLYLLNLVQNQGSKKTIFTGPL